MSRRAVIDAATPDKAQKKKKEEKKGNAVWRRTWPATLVAVCQHLSFGCRNLKIKNKNVAHALGDRRMSAVRTRRHSLAALACRSVRTCVRVRRQADPCWRYQPTAHHPSATAH
ncbi:hypothetical protein TW95_gp1232 [Pandoravirus inopinatum]|uniref:Uncharacterized protein n=1 Tax=Pandoravirus inopinatum TaxID=1605721 RepID=A0A0B5JAJ7_9VIRU|nr:hypothetical protein TW95_gp1232 [Pandoravirus inopinatum]AJF97966.1 hypothetical protein [Pandoravirus inopinatum]